MLITYCDLKNSFSELEITGQGVTIGYDEANLIVLDEIGISAFHMRLSAFENKLFVEDMQSLNGTYLNRKLLTEKAELRGGDTVLLGMILFRFEKDNDSWTISARRQDSSLFVVDEYKPLLDDDSGENVPTAVTMIAPKEVRDAIAGKEAERLRKAIPIMKEPLLKSELSLETLQDLGTYKIIKKIGKGGMGVVFLAKHKVMNTFRAVKVMPHSVKEENNDFFERFMREARIAAEFRHPNIVGVMDVENDFEKQVSYIVMEFVDGGSLRRILKNQKTLPEIQALLIVKSVAEALKVIAAHKIVHRDIKPDNIMFTRYGEVKLADLGIAKNQEEDLNLTRNNIMIGTPAYLSLEQIEKPKDVDIRSDIYSLGVTLYEMLTGTTPFAGKSTWDILQKMISEAVVDPRKKNPQVSAVTAKIVMKMLHKNPAKRYQSPQALLAALDRLLNRYSLSVAQNIIRSAVLGTELPFGVKKTVSSGAGSLLGFTLFNFRQNVAAFFSPFETGRKKGEKKKKAISEKHFTFHIDPALAAGDTVDFTIQAAPGTAWEITSSNGRSIEAEVSAEGRLGIKGLVPGEYRIRSRRGKDS
ncbi:MAG: protein kinase [Lentisphaeria bacterium]|nr:protein kinase [Lentisphaeria bacterium]